MKNEISCQEWREIVRDEKNKINFEEKQKNATRAIILMWSAAATAAISFALCAWSGAIVVAVKLVLSAVFAEKS